MKKFEDLPQEKQNDYLRKAKYLVKYNYVEGKSIETLAEEIYNKENDTR